MILMSPDYLEEGLLGLMKDGHTIVSVVPHELSPVGIEGRLVVRYYQVVSYKQEGSK